MGGDYTKFTFNPWANRSGVRMQQGRVQLDADWNELVDIIDRRWRAETIDIIGRCAAPREQPGAIPEGFRIRVPTPGTKALTIGRGRMYVHGLQAENFGAQPDEYDLVLGEPRGTKPLDYLDQPYAGGPMPDLAPLGVPTLVYLDVWQREVTALEAPEIVDVAVGVDTATRMQTAWQVRAVEDNTVTCAMSDDEWAAWLAAHPETAPSAGRLSTDTISGQPTDNVCAISPAGAYRGTDNRLYRVEIHTGGPLGTATFKWSRDNGSVATAVTEINGKVITVASLGRDRATSFANGDWVEITDDWRELNGMAGVLAQITADPDQVRLEITLSVAPPVGTNDRTKFNPVDTSRHTRLRRWDQSGQVRDVDGNLVTDLTLPGANGEIDIPAISSTGIVLEEGIQVCFSTEPGIVSFRPGDYWVFWARAVDGTLDELDKAPPRGVLHHYCRLAIVHDWNDQPEDCRHYWPPDIPTPVEGGCDCTVCVTAEGHNSGALTIQMAIDQVKASGGKICLGSGFYLLPKGGLVMDGAHAVILTGHGTQTVLYQQAPGPALKIQGSVDVQVEEMAFLSRALSIQVNLAAGLRLQELVLVDLGGIETMSGGVRLRNCLGATVAHCVIGSLTTLDSALSFGILLEGILAGVRIYDNLLLTGAAVAGQPSLPAGLPVAGDPNVPPAGYLATAGLFVEDNLIAARHYGISLDGASMQMSDTRLSRNVIYGPWTAAIVARGAVVALSQDKTQASARLDIQGNLIRVIGTGHGIVVGTTDTRIVDNDVSGVGPEDKTHASTPQAHGILLVPGLFSQQVADIPNIPAAAIVDCQIIGNRVRNMGGYGLYIGHDPQQTGADGKSETLINAYVHSAMIKHNFIERTGRGGIIMEMGGWDPQVDKQVPTNRGGAGTLQVEDNQLAAVADESAEQQKELGDDWLAGIRLCATVQAQVVQNTLSGVAPNAAGDGYLAGIEALGCATVQLQGNQVTVVGSYDFKGQAAGLHISDPLSHADVLDNAVDPGPGEGMLPSAWRALHVDSVSMPPKPSQEDPTLPRGAVDLAVRGNVLEARGTAEIAAVEVPGPCLFAENRCRHLMAKEDQKWLVFVHAGAIVASGNYVEGPQDLKIPALELDTSTKLLTVLGNITGGEIHVNGAPLFAPWDALNQVGI